MLNCMCDTTVFNRILDNRLSSSLFGGKVTIFATHIQRDELLKTTDPDRRAQLMRTFQATVDVSEPTRGAVWGVSRWGLSSWGDAHNDVKAALDQKRKHRNNTKDALIAATALASGYTLVTDDRRLREVAESLGCKCMCSPELVVFCKT